jgi:hypothetical protein
VPVAVITLLKLDQEGSFNWFFEATRYFLPATLDQVSFMLLPEAFASALGTLLPAIVTVAVAGELTV